MGFMLLGLGITAIKIYISVSNKTAEYIQNLLE
jgi:hypothetical protein